MSYQVAIRKNETGEVRMYSLEFDWEKEDGYTDHFWWTDGNFGCDCNRESSWLRAGGPGPEDDPHWNGFETRCSQGRFTALYALLPDGTRVPIDDPTDPAGGNL